MGKPDIEIEEKKQILSNFRFMQEKEKMLTKALHTLSNNDDDMQTELVLKIDECRRYKAYILIAISEISNMQQQKVLYKRYINGMDYDMIAEEMFIVKRRVFQIHKAALEAINLPKFE